MASDDEIDRLIAEAEAALGNRPVAPRPAGPPARSSSAEPAAGRYDSPVKVSAISGGVAAALVFATFAVLPFLGALSGAAGAFVATFFIVLGQRLFRRRR